MKIAISLSIALLAIAPLSAQEPTPADAPAPTVVPPPTPAMCPECGMDKNASGCTDDKPAKPTPANEEADLTQLEHSWGDAIVHSDETALARIVADEYTSVGPDGDVSNKTGHLAAARAVAGKISSFKFSGVQVRVYGNTAVVMGNGMIHWSTSQIDGSQPTNPFRWTDVFVRRDGRWQAVASQATTIGKAALAED